MAPKLEPGPTPAHNRVQPSHLFRNCLPPASQQQTHLPSLRRFLFTSHKSVWALRFCNPLPIPVNPLFTFSPLRIATFGSPANHLPASFPLAPHLPASDGRTCPPFYTDSLQNSASNRGPSHGFHTTTRYLFFYTAPLTRLPHRVEPTLCHLSLRNNLATCHHWFYSRYLPTLCQA